MSNDSKDLHAAIPPNVFWAPLADNFYGADGKGQGLDFYRQWHARRSEFPQGESAGWGHGSAHNPFTDPPRGAAASSAAPAPAIVFEASSKTASMLFSTKEAADSFVASFPSTVGGGFTVTARHVATQGSAPAADATAQPVAMWQTRAWRDGCGGEPVGWGCWEELKPRGLQTIEQAVKEMRDYIAQGYRYEIRALYAAPAQQPPSSDAADATAQPVGAEPAVPACPDCGLDHGPKRADTLSAELHAALKDAKPGEFVSVRPELLRQIEGEVYARSAPAILERRRRDAQALAALERMTWLHSTQAVDADGYEWGVFRIKWEDGRAVDVQRTRADHFDVDASRAASPSPSSDAVRMAREALERIANVGAREEFPGHHNGALHLRCRSCQYRWCPSVEKPAHAKECPAEIARAALSALSATTDGGKQL